MASSRSGPPWRAWYKTPAWRALKVACHQRDNYRCCKCRRECLGKYPAPDSPVADHKKAHRGDKALFFDLANLQTICMSPCHNKLKQREEQASKADSGVWY